MKYAIRKVWRKSQPNSEWNYSMEHYPHQRALMGVFFGAVFAVGFVGRVLRRVPMRPEKREIYGSVGQDDFALFLDRR